MYTKYEPLQMNLLSRFYALEFKIDSNGSVCIQKETFNASFHIIAVDR